MGTNYKEDRGFTDFIHKKIAISKIYDVLGWSEYDVGEVESVRADLFEGIDYHFQDEEGNIITTQERFRDSYYQQYNDFTIRFEREYNPHEERRQSEFYKINADYFVYGITNGSKFRKNEITDYIKFAVVDLHVVRQLIEDGRIYINRAFRGVCRMVGDVMHCPVNYNHDDSSSFFPVDVQLLLDYFSEYNPVLFQKGFRV